MFLLTQRSVGIIIPGWNTKNQLKSPSSYYMLLPDTTTISSCRGVLFSFYLRCNEQKHAKTCIITTCPVPHAEACAQRLYCIRERSQQQLEPAEHQPAGRVMLLIIMLLHIASMYGIYANIGGILMGSMSPYIIHI